MKTTSGGVSRRSVTKLIGAAAAMAWRPGLGRAEERAQYTVEIGPVSLEIAPGRFIRTTGYNGQVPGPLLRFREGEPVVIDLRNGSDRAEVVHWHGLFLPPEMDGAVEEGTPLLAPGATRRITFTPQPSGFRWYHTHTMAGNDLARAQYGGQHGFLMVEPRSDPARYDQEFFLGLHDWEGRLLASDDGAMNPTYGAATINGRAMGFGEPLRVKGGQRVLLHVLNSSPTEVHWLSMSGHSFQVVAMDGNPVAATEAVAMLRLAPAERICAVVEMNNPGVWVLGEVRKHVHASGMAMVVEYAGHGGSPQWQQPQSLDFDYGHFRGVDQEGEQTPVITVPLVLASKFRGHGNMEAWTINGKSYPEASIAPLQRGQRYRFEFINRSLDDHPMHLHRHSFVLRRTTVPLKRPETGTALPAEMHGPRKDTVLVTAQTMTAVEFVANNPGDTLLHCHQQNHMDLGFMMVLHYA